jgi:hypothetical protein
LDRPPYHFYESNRVRVEAEVAQLTARPIAEPLNGALAVGFLTSIVVIVAFFFVDERDVSSYRQEGISGWVGIIFGTLAYFFFRSQHRTFDSAVAKQMQLLWETQSER